LRPLLGQVAPPPADLGRARGVHGMVGGHVEHSSSPLRQRSNPRRQSAAPPNERRRRSDVNQGRKTGAGESPAQGNRVALLQLHRTDGFVFPPSVRPITRPERQRWTEPVRRRWSTAELSAPIVAIMPVTSGPPGSAAAATSRPAAATSPSPHPFADRKITRPRRRLWISRRTTTPRCPLPAPGRCAHGRARPGGWCDADPLTGPPVRHRAGRGRAGAGGGPAAAAVVAARAAGATVAGTGGPPGACPGGAAGAAGRRPAAAGGLRPGLLRPTVGGCGR